jgi:Tol biopolymer transport system component
VWVAILLAVGAAGYWLGTRNGTPAKSAELTQFTIAPPPGFFLDGATPRQTIAVSPDGSKVAFAAVDASGLFRIFIRTVGELESREVTGSTGAGTLFWLHDGSLVYAARGKLWRLSPGASTSQVFAETLPSAHAGVELSSGRMMMSNRFGSAILPANGGPFEHRKDAYPWPQVLPDGEQILHSVFDLRLGCWQIRARRLDERAPAREIASAGSRAIYTRSPATGRDYLLYTSGGVMVAQPFDVEALRTTGGAKVIGPRIFTFLPSGSADFSVSTKGNLLVYMTAVQRSQLVWVDRTGRQLRAAGPDRISTRDARLSPDGLRFASAVYDLERGATAIWVTDVATSQSRRQIVGPGLVNAPVWSPDSKRMAFMRAWESTPKLRVRSLEDQQPEQSLASDGFQVPTDWTRDGRFILYTNTGLTLVENEGQADIWVADLERGGKLSPLIRTPFHEANASVSPDGRWVAFTSNESGRPEVYMQRLEIKETLTVTGPRHLVSREGTVCLRWRRDGKELFYLGGDGRVYAVALGGTPKPLFKIAPEAIAAVHSLMGFDVAADGQSFVVPTVTSPEAPVLVAVQNWEELLTPKAAPVSSSRH